MSENGDVAVVDNTTAPSLANQFDIVDVKAAKEFMNNYQDLVEALLESEDYQMIGGKSFKKKSAWRKLATAFNISDTIIKEEIFRDDVCGIVSAKYYVKATLPNGRSSVGVGVCSIFDKIRYQDTNNYVRDTEQPSNFELRGRFSNAEHDVPSTAHTRAKNRAIADLIGAGEVSADELDNVGEKQQSTKKVTRRSSKDTTIETKAEPVTRKSKDEPETVNDIIGETISSTEEKPKRTARKRARKRAPKTEVIETNAEVVEETPTPAKGKTSYHSIDNSAVKKAILRIEEAEEEVTLSSITDEIFNLYDIGDIDIDEYDEAKAALGL